ncbi:hypothetical protein BT93_L4634 [Corymbia citriodora subsp. variegata]|uniref:Fe2OG dioxygenase domain-containing protein n=1 Tax=Corymbia citriodora subsp. variegata TaxID=360336 RepID=A0A8T0CJZ6_CORYI|nr:hypothetical protein BT93_L4634 [Corymbia citriodora subsp. variegata]
MSKRTLDGFLGRPTVAKKQRLSSTLSGNISTHPTYPFPIPHLGQELGDVVAFSPAEDARVINDQPDLDLLYFQPFIQKTIVDDLFQFLRSQLFFYRVSYKIKRGSFETQINTPRFTTVFGVDESSRFNETGDLVENATKKPIPKDRYKNCQPRPIPDCLDVLRKITEGCTGNRFNFCLVNYYKDGADSISYHSDDERFLGPDPAIASFSFGAKRDFLMKHKPDKDGAAVPPGSKPLKLPLDSGDMVLMRGRTQSNWLHSIPKRALKSGESDKGRINITFRRAMVVGGTENYYRYNVGSDGVVFKWDDAKKDMLPWKGDEKDP